MSIPGFDYQRVPVADGVSLHAAVGGSGSPIVLLHGFPQTHLMWRHVAADLAADHTVICPDLRGYGASDKPAEPAGTAYAKRTMAADVVALARALGHERFALAGHDRGALVAFRAGLDHPDTITHLACLDVLPTLDMWDVMHGVDRRRRLPPLPDGPAARPARAADRRQRRRLLRPLPRPLGQRPATRSPPTSAPPTWTPAATPCRRSSPTTAPPRASTSSTTRPTAPPGDRLPMPVTVLQQDWGAALGFDAAALWRAWAPDLRHATVDCGHFMAEEAPAEITRVLRNLMAR